MNRLPHTNNSLQKPKGLGFMTTKLGCCYYSNLSKEKKQPVLGKLQCPLHL